MNDPPPPIPAVEPPSEASPAPPQSGAVPIPSVHDIPRGSVPGALEPMGTFGKYELLGRIAFGGMAEIFLARENLRPGTARMLVIKRILPHVADDENFIEMFSGEARLAVQLNHPNICHIYDFGQLDQHHYIAMEWVDGKSLGRLTRRAKKKDGIPAHIAAWIAARIAEALHYAHHASDAMGRPLGIVHRDVSPHNIMIGYSGVVKLLDFGIAKAQTHSIKTKAGVIKGKFAYMSPQQCKGVNVDGRADVFALGICLFEALTGKSPFKQETEYETMRQVVEGPTPSIRDVDPELPLALDMIVQEALQKKLEHRFQSAADFQEALEDWIANSGKAVTRGKVAAFMRGQFATEIERGPMIDTNPSGASFKSFPSRPSGSHRSWHTPVSQPEAPRADIPIDLGDLEIGASRRPRWGLRLAFLVAVVGGAGAIAWATTGDEQAAQSSQTGEPVAQPSDPGAEELDTTDESAAEEAVPVDTGTVAIRSTPPGASVRVGDRDPVGPTPTSIDDLAPGTYTVTVTHDGHEPWTSEVEVAAGDRVVLQARLEGARAPPTKTAMMRVARMREPATPRATGRLYVNTRPWSKVYVGRRSLGTTPIGRASVPAGTVRLRLVDRDGRTHNRTVQIPANGTERVFYDLSR